MRNGRMNITWWFRILTRFADEIAAIVEHFTRANRRQTSQCGMRGRSRCAWGSTNARVAAYKWSRIRAQAKIGDHAIDADSRAIDRAQTGGARDCPGGARSLSIQVGCHCVSTNVTGSRGGGRRKMTCIESATTATKGAIIRADGR